MDVQFGLSRTLSEAPKTGFVVLQLFLKLMEICIKNIEIGTEQIKTNKQAKKLISRNIPTKSRIFILKCVK